MEQEAGSILGAVISAFAGLAGAEDAARSYDLLTEVPAEYRPLRLSAIGRTYDLRPADLRVVTVSAKDFPSLLLEFQELPTAWIAETTAAGIGTPMAIAICGEEVINAVIQTPITDGRVQITGGAYGIEDLARFAELISGERLCPVAEATGPAK